MMYVITGGSGSGKSEYAEKLAGSICKKDKRLLYLATMHPYGEEAWKRIERHRDQRQGKGFVTVECYENLSQIYTEKEDTVLFECMSNYVANAMFDDSKEKIEEKTLASLITKEISALKNRTENLVLVSNEIFTDGIMYEEETMRYLRCLGRINESISKMADGVTEVVAGIPVHIKTIPYV